MSEEGIFLEKKQRHGDFENFSTAGALGKTASIYSNIPKIYVDHIGSSLWRKKREPNVGKARHGIQSESCVGGYCIEPSQVSCATFHDVVLCCVVL